MFLEKFKPYFNLQNFKFLKIKRFSIFIFLILQIFYVHAQSMVPDQLPSFALSDLMGLIQSRINYPIAAFEANISGKVFVEFIITQTGEVADAKVLKGIGYGCDEEALTAIISTSGNWNPASLNGKLIAYKQTLAIKFQPKIDFQPRQEEKEEAGDTTVFSFVEIEPKPPGGDLQKYFFEFLHYPKEAVDNEISGNVLVSFVISSNGKVQDVHLLKGIGYGCDEEALRVIKEMADWTPALNGGKRVKCRVTVPVVFKLMGDFPKKSTKPLASSFDFQSFIDKNISAGFFAEIIEEVNPIRFSFQLGKKGIHQISIYDVKNAQVEKELKRVIKLMSSEILFEPEKANEGIMEISAAIDPLKFEYCRIEYFLKFRAFPVLKSIDFNKMVKDSLFAKTDAVGEMAFSFLVDTNGKVKSPRLINTLGRKADSILLQVILRTSGNWFSPRLGQKKILGVVSIVLFIGIEEDAKPPEGDLSLFFNRNIKIPEEANKQKIDGRLRANFLVDKEGKISEIRIGIPGCCGWNEEMIRVLKLSSGLWTPKKRNGKNVLSERQLDFVFPYK